MSYQSTTLADLRVKLAHRVEDQPWWTPDSALRAINEGLRVWNILTGMWTAARPVTTAPNDPILAVGGALTLTARVSVGGIPLATSSIRALDHTIRDWEHATTTSGGIHPTRPVYWAPVGLTEIAIYPATAVPTTLVISGVATTVILDDEADYVDLGEDEISTLLGYALHTLSFSKGIAAVHATLTELVAFYAAAGLKNRVLAGSTVYKQIMGIDRTRLIRPFAAPPSAESLAMQQQLEHGTPAPVRTLSPDTRALVPTGGG
ncbi:MAG TPA: hypothetical protein VFO16_24105 [Pseudonocardiaceae bacterium]|nr:hypothetical protein [Pseudonocardiaceae bacterium]